MDWDKAQKIATLILTIVTAIAVPSTALYLTWNKNGFDKSTTCLTMHRELYALSNTAESLDLQQHRMQALIAPYSETCGALKNDEVLFLMNGIHQTGLVSVATAPVANSAALPSHVESIDKSSPIQTVYDADTATFVQLKDGTVMFRIDQNGTVINMGFSAKLGSIGWVKLGRIGGSYSQINFEKIDLADPAKLPADFSQPLPSKWPMNLRSNPPDSELSKNQILGQVYEGDCVLPSDTHVFQGQLWAKATVVECK